MVEKTAVLHQRRIMRMCQDADLPVGKHEAADQIVLQITFDRETERFLGQTAPRFAGNIAKIEPAPEVFFRNQRFQHCVPDMFGKNVRQIVKFFHLLVLDVASSKIDNRLPARLFSDIAQEQSVMLAVLHVWRK